MGIPPTKSVRTKKGSKVKISNKKRRKSKGCGQQDILRARVVGKCKPEQTSYPSIYPTIHLSYYTRSSSKRNKSKREIKSTKLMNIMVQLRTCSTPTKPTFYLNPHKNITGHRQPTTLTSSSGESKDN